MVSPLFQRGVKEGEARAPFLRDRQGLIFPVILPPLGDGITFFTDSLNGGSHDFLGFTRVLVVLVLESVLVRRRTRLHRAAQ